MEATQKYLALAFLTILLLTACQENPKTVWKKITKQIPNQEEVTQLVLQNVGQHLSLSALPDTLLFTRLRIGRCGNDYSVPTYLEFEKISNIETILQENLQVKHLSQEPLQPKNYGTYHLLGELISENRLMIRESLDIGDYHPNQNIWYLRENQQWVLDNKRLYQSYKVYPDTITGEMTDTVLVPERRFEWKDNQWIEKEEWY